ncbi:MAG: MATE family efflux transporter [Lachnospiraceae bacterium]
MRTSGVTRYEVFTGVVTASQLVWCVGTQNGSGRFFLEKGEVLQYLFSKKDLRKLIIPLFIEQFLLISVGIVDIIMVASVGEGAVSAVNLVDTIMVLLINVFTALATGGAIVAGQYLGKKNEEKGCEATEQLVLAAAVISVVIMVLMYFAKGFILHVVFGEIDDAVMRMCNQYFVFVTLSIPFIAIYNAGAAIYRSMGDSKTPMFVSLLMNVIHIAGNAVLIYGLHFGVEGAAIPTLFSRILAGVSMMLLLRYKKRTLYIRRFSAIRPNLKMLKKIFHIGIPFGIENSMFQLGKILVLSVVSRFGTTSIAANAVANSIATVAVLTGIAADYALSAVSAQCVGAGQYDQVRYYTKKILRYAYTSIIVTNVVIALLLPVIIQVYNLSPDTAALTRQIILYHAVLSSLIWPLSFTMPSTLRAANDVGYCMWISILSMWIFRIICSYVLADYFALGVMGVWIAMTIDWAVRAAFFTVRYVRGRWQFHAI